MSWDQEQLDELLRDRSRLAVEVEQLTHELMKVSQDNEDLKLENERLQQELQERDEIHMKMREQLGFVTETASTLYKKFREFKIKYYKEQGLG